MGDEENKKRAVAELRKIIALIDALKQMTNQQTGTKEEGTMNKEEPVSNVVSLADRRQRKKEEKDNQPPMDGEAINNYFQEVIERNRQIKEKRRNERQHHNKKTLRDNDLK